MSTIIVHNESSASDQEALYKVSTVIGMGRISNEGKQYCYATTFHPVNPGDPGLVVVTAKNKRSDTFIVRDDHRSEK